jgi:integrase
MGIYKKQSKKYQKNKDAIENSLMDETAKSAALANLDKDNKETWYIDYYADGKRLREAIGSKTAAKKALHARTTDILRGEFRFKKEKKIRFEDFAKEYLEYSKINKRSWLRDETSLKNLLPFFKDVLLSKINPQYIEDYKRMRLNTESLRKRKIKPATINRELSCLKHIFTIAARFEKFEGKNPVKETKFFQESQYIMRILSKEEIEKLVNASSSFLRALIMVALNTGMRKGELLNLRWIDVDFNENYIYIKQTKSNVPRKIPMNSIAKNALAGMKKEGEFIFPRTRNERMVSIFYQFKATCRKVGISDLRFHDLRHTAATLMVMGGIDIVTVSQILGHANIQQTTKYSHPTPENKRRAVDVLASMFRPDPKRMDTWQTQGQNEASEIPLLSTTKH